MLADAPVMLAVCDAFDIASINRGPLAVGLLTGKGPRRLPAARGDVRGPGGPSWLGYRTDGRPAAELLARLGAIREQLTGGGRTLAQGALGLLLARSPPCRSRGSAQWPKPSRTPRRYGWGHSRPPRWRRSPGCPAG